MLRACPFLPKPDGPMDWRGLHAHRDRVRGPAFYLECLSYAQVLWRSRLPARSLLCLDRAFGADLRGGEPVLKEWPLPYEAVAWVMRNAPPGAFLGNPRVHFQHYAGRMNTPRRDQRRWRAWACWALARATLSGLPGDPAHRVVEPSLATIANRLRAHGIDGEAALWRAVLDGIGPGHVFV
jgi:hypothetical protein